MNQKKRNVHEVAGVNNCLVDGFRFKIYDEDFEKRYYILSHFHSDHYGGLNSAWKNGLIYCTTITADLIEKILGVNRKYIVAIDFEKPFLIGDTKVIFLDANHCPGAAIVLFELVDGTCHLHTGDMRYDPRMKDYTALMSRKIQNLYLDTTYAHTKHRFISQEQSVQVIVNESKQFLSENSDGMVLLSAYTIGKERIFSSVLDSFLPHCERIYADDDKIKLLQYLGPEMKDRVLNGQFTTDPDSSRIHICKMGFAGDMWPYFRPNFDNIEKYMLQLNTSLAEKGFPRRVSKVLAFIPTGWADASNHNRKNAVCIKEIPAIVSPSPTCFALPLVDSKAPQSVSIPTDSCRIGPDHNSVVEFDRNSPGDGNEYNSSSGISSGNISSSISNSSGSSSSTEQSGSICVRLVPYSEHSQFSELLEFVSFLKPVKVIPTVYNDEKNKQYILDLFRNSVDRNANKRAFLSSMGNPRRAVASPSSPSPADREEAESWSQQQAAVEEENVSMSESSPKTPMAVLLPPSNLQQQSIADESILDTSQSVGSQWTSTFRSGASFLKQIKDSDSLLAHSQHEPSNDTRSSPPQLQRRITGYFSQACSPKDAKKSRSLSTSMSVELMRVNAEVVHIDDDDGDDGDDGDDDGTDTVDDGIKMQLSRNKLVIEGCTVTRRDLKRQKLTSPTPMPSSANADEGEGGTVVNRTLVATAKELPTPVPVVTAGVHHVQEWVCKSCTFSHSNPQHLQYLMCAICAAPKS